jgi:hypothetical protein
MRHFYLFAAALLLAGSSPLFAGVPEQTLSDRPAAYWRFEGGVAENAIAPLTTKSEGAVQFGVPGPRPPVFPDFDAGNSAVQFSGKGAFVRVANSETLKFRAGELHGSQ